MELKIETMVMKIGGFKTFFNQRLNNILIPLVLKTFVFLLGITPQHCSQTASLILLPTESSSCYKN